MEKILILCYSKTGNSKFIAEKLADKLHCDLEMITPVFNSVGVLFLLTLLNIPISVNISRDKINDYRQIIVIGPIWGAHLIAPLKSVLKICIDLKKQIHFAVTCEGKESDKNSKYGYNTVLKKAQSLGGPLVKSTTAFPTSLISGYDEKDYNVNEKAKFTENNFSAELSNRLDELINKIVSPGP